MALYDDFLAGRLGDEDRLLKLSFEGRLTGDEFLRATPAERQRYLTHNQFSQNIGVNPKSAAHALRSITNGPQETPLTEQQVVQALSGMDPSFVGPVANEFGGMVTAWQQSMADKDFGSRLVDAASDFADSDYFIPAIAGGLFGAAGAFSGLGGAEAGLESASGGGSTAAAAEGGIGGVGGSGLTAAEMAELEAMAASDIATGGILGPASGSATFGNQVSSLLNGGSSLKFFTDNALGLGGLTSGLSSMFGGNASGGGTFGGGSGVDWAARAAGAVPVLAAINYAKNQGPFDTSRLEQTYNQFEPDALAFEFDQNTARGRNDLTSSLTNRGVMGSSFGNMDLTNFQTSRDLGRRSLINQGLAARGGLASSILDTQIKERGLKNDLYGRSLLALGNIFGGRN